MDSLCDFSQSSDLRRGMIIMMMPERSDNSSFHCALDTLQTLYLGGFEVEKDRVAVIKF